MTTPRKDRKTRRNLNAQEMHDMGYADLRANADEDGWPYPDDDDVETTERYMGKNGKVRDNGRRK